MGKDWYDAEKAAIRILGPEAKIPAQLPSVVKAAEKSHDSWAKFKAVGKPLKDALDDHKEKAANFLGAWQAQEDEVKKENFGLDPTKDAKKIAAARKEFVEAVEDTLQINKNLMNDIKKLEAAVKIIMDAQ